MPIFLLDKSQLIKQFNSTGPECASEAVMAQYGGSGRLAVLFVSVLGRPKL